MAKILVKNNLVPAVYEFIIEAPMIAHKCQPGQFVMIRTDENSERIPLTIADFDREKRDNNFDCANSRQYYNTSL